MTDQDLPLHLKYRPTTFDEVVGHEAVVSSLKSTLKKKAPPHAFLFSGPTDCPGLGKTTLARIVASHLGIDSRRGVIEVDAATNTGIDAMRDLKSSLQFATLGSGSDSKMIIIDECHALSKAAWQSLLKVVEEPPSHVFFAFCTTEVGKVPKTIMSRCHDYALKPLSVKEITALLEDVADAEKMSSSVDEFIEGVARKAEGSPRRALVYLSKVSECGSRAEAMEVLEDIAESSQVIDLARMLVNGKGLTWAKASQILMDLKDQNPESVRIQIANYLHVVVLKARTESEAMRVGEILDLFSKPISSTEGFIPITLSVMDVIGSGASR